eukprot:CAMPEP_0113557206 /NCGR_PEP_ID=MMETSP0015_2-20120614/17664_1 /TAXON_ID=2838 /ORGANISM="Odontella" /LENGTH=245 /DNA_ID=CAMNT_0000458609 /DNA_START=13 /DNA_END=750 /DNA_ORIENTATION=- /assembly_acc=CAM_ASM_000160
MASLLRASRQLPTIHMRALIPSLASHRREFSAVSSARSRSRNADRLIRATRKWLEDVVIGQRLCPFAPPVLSEPHKLRIVASNASNEDVLVEELTAEAGLIVGKLGECEATGSSDRRRRPETTLLVLDTALFPEMSTFRTLVQASWRLQSDSIHARGFESDLQIVLFHPEATHNTYAAHAGEEDAGDFTIRSPYPTIHLLREVDVMSAVKSGYKDLEGLPGRNRTRLREEGVEVCRERLDACQKT